MKPKTFFVCTECGYKTSKWFGRCPTCQEWNTAEETFESAAVASPTVTATASQPAIKLSEMQLPEYMRVESGIGELDRVLGGGIVSGSVVLISGEPGIGKSTLLTQVCGTLGVDRRVLYISGEESPGQIKLRAKRLGITADGLYILTETDADAIFSEIEKIHPDIIVVDSIQTVNCAGTSSVPGSVTQVKEAALRFISLAKNTGTSVIVVGHVNKEGSIAGPKVLEHMVDAVICFEGDRQNSYRIVRAAKNRFGSTNEIGVFEMTSEGLEEVPNPSEALLAGRPVNVSGNCAVSIMEGTRPLIAEIQALSSPTVFTSPRRTTNGIDYSRLYMLLAVLEKRLGLRFSVSDVYLNVIGGLRLDEPGADLAAALALISAVKDKPLPDDIVAVGEIGLAGECRAVSCIEQRVSEADRLGFSRIILPARGIPDGLARRVKIKLIPIKSLFDVLTADIWGGSSSSRPS